MKGDCSFGWYWWNWCPSLFKLSFHNFVQNKKMYFKIWGLLLMSLSLGCINSRFTITFEICAKKNTMTLFRTIHRSFLQWYGSSKWFPRKIAFFTVNRLLWTILAGGDWSSWWKSQTSHNSLTKFITYSKL